MNPRIIELVKNPGLIRKEDLEMLRSSIDSAPYLQNIRALYLLGTAKFDAENYRKVLSATAAYTTDKKILYQLINGKSEQTDQTSAGNIALSSPPETSYLHTSELAAEQTAEKENVSIFPDEDLVAEDISAELIDTEQEIEAEPENTQPESEVELAVEPAESKVETDDREMMTTDNDEEQVVNQQVDSAEEGDSGISETQEVQSEQIEIQANDSEVSGPEHNDLAEDEGHHEESSEAELELVENDAEQRAEEKMEAYEEAISDDTDAGTPEMIIEEKHLEIEKELVEDPSVLSFHGSQEFMPEVTVAAAKSEPETHQPTKPKENRHEEEMRRLIEEVERKMRENRAKKSEKPKTEEEPSSAEISFSETMDFYGLPQEKSELSKEKETSAETISKSETDSHNKKVENDTVNPEQPTAANPDDASKETVETTENSDWKPMAFATPSADSTVNPAVESKSEDLQESESGEESVEENAPVISVSFFTPEVTEIKPDDAEAEQEKNAEAVSDNKSDSNIPQFINTWQSWLKIDRSEDAAPVQESTSEVADVEVSNQVSKEEIKEKAIEKFIETEPKISQLKQDANFVVKEKKDDISHLMTETLARIYAEQKLYAKAIKAYEILSKKHPEKADYFTEKIEEVKEIRSNSNQ